MSDYQHCSGGKHQLVDIMTTSAGFEGGTRVVRWCRNCGAVVVDVDVDTRVQPGGIMPMMFPRIAQQLGPHKPRPPVDRPQTAAQKPMDAPPPPQTDAAATGGEQIRRRFAWLPIHRWSSEVYRNGSYWLCGVVERHTSGGWKALEADN